MTVIEHDFSRKQVEETQRKARNLRTRMLADGTPGGFGNEARALIEVLDFVVEARTRSVSRRAATPRGFVDQAPKEITPQQAAVILGMSRPSVMRLIAGGHLHARKVLSRNKLLHREVEAFRLGNTQQQRRALRALSALSEEFDF